MAKPPQPKILVAMPAYNEEKYIGSLVLKARQYGDEVLVVDPPNLVFSLCEISLWGWANRHKPSVLETILQPCFK